MAESKGIPMSPAHARALAMARELSSLLGELNKLAENGDGSSVDDAWNRMDDVIGLLEPLAKGWDRLHLS